jgi:hypothetical protein
MRKHKGSEPSRPASLSYLLPEDAHLALLQTRDQLRLLALLADPHGCNELELSLPPSALAECFWRLARDLDEVVGAAAWPGRTGEGQRQR